MLDTTTYRRLLLGVALTHMVLVPLVFLLVSFFVSRRARGARDSHVSASLLCVAFATALTGVPALVGGLAWNPRTAVEQMTRFYLLMIISGATAARLPGLISGLRLRKLPFHGVFWSLLAALGDVLAWVCLDLLVLSDFTQMYLWLFILVGFPAFLGRIAAHSYHVMAQVGMRPPHSSPGRMAAPALRQHSFPDPYGDDFDEP